MTGREEGVQRVEGERPQIVLLDPKRLGQVAETIPGPGDLFVEVDRVGDGAQRGGNKRPGVARHCHGLDPGPGSTRRKLNTPTGVENSRLRPTVTLLTWYTASGIRP
jgi:hypothetical protein